MSAIPGQPRPGQFGRSAPERHNHACSYGRGKKRVGWLEMKEAIADTASLRRLVQHVALAGLAMLVLALLIVQFMRTV